MNSRRDGDFLKQVVDEAVKILVTNFPTVKDIATELFDVVFIPKTVAKQLLLAVVLQTGVVTIEQIWSILHSIFSNFSPRSRLIRQLQRQQNQAETQDEWMDLAERIDNIQGNDVWRSQPDCPLYERERISARIDDFLHLMRRRDIFELMFTLRSGIHRNKFGLLHEGLFTKAMAGTKVLVETYHNVVCAALDYVCDAPVPPGEEPIPTEARLAFFNETRHAYGRTALLLSGGAALGFYHTGVVKALMDNGLMPRVLGGASAGSICCAMIGTRTDDECMNDLFHAKGTTAPGHSGRLALNFFRPIRHRSDSEWGGDVGEVLQNSAGAFKDAKRTWQVFIPIGFRQLSSLMYDLLTGNCRPQEVLNHDTEHFRQCMRTNCGNFTFQEAFDRTGRILNITVTPNNSSDPPRLLNYLTAPHVLVWSAAVASSSLPGVFESNKLMVKDADGTERFESAEGTQGNYFSDGSMEADLPMQQLSEMFNVNHFVISQANPHAVMFASLGITKTVWTSPLVGLMTSTLQFLKSQCRAWLKHVVELVSGRRIAPLFETSRGIVSNFFTQEYEGRDCDISLIPWINHRSFFSALLHCIYNPSYDDFVEWGKAAERETYKHIPAIKSHIAEEVTLDRCVSRLRGRLIAESWEKKRSVSSTQKIDSRVPSFYTSPSLVNMGGLGVADQTNISAGSVDSAQHEHNQRKKDHNVVRRSGEVLPSGLDPNFGWGGMGLRGNHSNGSLTRTLSGGSGLFPMDEDEHGGGTQSAGERTATASPALAPFGGLTPSAMKDKKDGPYIKTTSMARFYYRKTQSSDSTENLRHTQSHSQLSFATASSLSGSVSTGDTTHNRRKSKSSFDLSRIARVR